MPTSRRQSGSLIGRFGRAVTGRTLRRSVSERDLIALESQIGRQLFGEVPKGVRREFFNLDPHTWMWHEEWVDPTSKQHRVQTVRYEVQPDRIVKVADGVRYARLTGKELDDFVLAVQLYYDRVLREIYHYDPATGRPLPQD